MLSQISSNLIVSNSIWWNLIWIKNVNLKMESGGGRRELQFHPIRQSGNIASNAFCLFLSLMIKLNIYSIEIQI